MIVEVTPRWLAIMTAKGVDWSTRTLRDRVLGRWVKVTGWMLFDVEHRKQAENTAPGRPRNWRATAWEIHPITAIKVVTVKRHVGKILRKLDEANRTQAAMALVRRCIRRKGGNISDVPEAL